MLLQARNIGRVPSGKLLAAFCAIYCALIGPVSPVTAGDSRWVDSRRIGPFVCQATFALTDEEQLLGELPELQRELSRTLGIPAANEQIHIYLFASAAEHQQYIAAHFPQVPYRQALFIEGDGQLDVYAYRQAELATDLRHECTHALLHAAVGDLPLWLDEGLAEYFEAPAARRAFEHPNFDALRWNLRLGMVRPIAALERRRELAEMSRLDYCYSWAWVHWMLHGPPGAHWVLIDYLADARGGKADGDLSTRLNAAAPNASEQLVRHFKHWSR